MRREIVAGLVLLSAAFTLVATHRWSLAAETSGGAEAKPIKILLRIPLPSVRTRFVGIVETISKDGGLRIVPVKNDSSSAEPAREPVAEGYYVGLVRGVRPTLANAQLVRVSVSEILDDGVIAAQVAPGLDRKIWAGKWILLVRPPDTSTAQMKAIPDWVQVEKGNAPQGALTKRPEDGDQERAARSARNLREIGVALHKFHRIRNQFPPAAFVGPDGKAWHSWRVLLLPFLEQYPLYHKYRFDEPWDGPNNKKLLDSMPRVYTDAPPKQATDHFTRYAAVTGEGMLFSAEGASFDGKKPRFTRGTGTWSKQVSDGLSNTLAVGTLSPEEKIPWMKPVDVVVGEKLVGIGQKGGFGAPYRSEKGEFALFLRSDGSVTGIVDTIDKELFHSMLTIAGGEVFDWQKVSAAFNPQIAAPAREDPVIYLFQEGDQTKARYVK